MGKFLGRETDGEVCRCKYDDDGERKGLSTPEDGEGDRNGEVGGRGRGLQGLDDGNGPLFPKLLAKLVSSLYCVFQSYSGHVFNRTV